MFCSGGDGMYGTRGSSVISHHHTAPLRATAILRRVAGMPPLEAGQPKGGACGLLLTAAQLQPGSYSQAAAATARQLPTGVMGVSVQATKAPGARAGSEGGASSDRLKDARSGWAAPGRLWSSSPGGSLNVRVA